MIAAPPRTAAPQVRAVPLDRITADPALRARADAHPPEAVADLVAALDRGAEPPPAVVYLTPAGQHLLADGWLLLAAYALAGRGSMPCEVREGTRRQALLAAAASNAVPGVARRTNADKRRAVELVLGECPDWTGRRVADHCRVSHTFVDQIKAGPPPAPPGGNVATCPEVRQGRDGKSYPAPAPVARVIGVKPADEAAAERERTLVEVCGRLAVAVAELSRLDGGRPTDRTNWAEAARLAGAARRLAWGDRPGEPPGAVGTVARQALPDGRPFPTVLAAHQLNAKHVALLDERLEEGLVGERPVALAGRVLTPAERFDLVVLMQRALLPEVYG